jgi:ABC-type transport system involved in multi-copper enzyme maturation permease subunit
MNQIRVIYHLARADFLERVRRYSFLIMLGLVVFLGYQTGIGNMTLELGQYRGEYNSAWVGAMMSLIATFFLGWFGFYLVKGSVARDRETGVGQIMATTPLTRPLYAFGKWISNFLVLMAMVSVLALAGIAIQLIQGENTGIDISTFIAPFLFVVLPVMALVAAFAVLFEMIPFLAGGFGNLVYFFAFLMLFPILDKMIKNNPAFEPLGIGLFMNDMQAAVLRVYPDYSGGFSLGSGGETIIGTFKWVGIHWTPDLLLPRFLLLMIAVLLTLVSAVFFDRFDPSRRNPKRLNSKASVLKPVKQSQSEVASASQPLSQPVHLTPLSRPANGFAFLRVLISEMKMLLKGQRWWWYAVAAGLFIAALVNTPENVRAFVLPFTWIWPILIWSGLGNRESQHNTRQMVFSSAAPLMRQLPAQWLAGFLVTALTGSGVAIKLLSAGDGGGLLAWMSAVLFIPSFALALGVWSNSHKLFEVLYVTIWYLGPMNKIETVDLLGANSSGNPGFFLPLSMALIVAAFIGRARQLQN